MTLICGADICLFIYLADLYSDIIETELILALQLVV
jgi:hypothetical protein